MVFIDCFIGLVFLYSLDYIDIFFIRPARWEWCKPDPGKLHQLCCIHATSSWNYKEIFTFLLRRDDAVWQNGFDLTVWGGLAVGALAGDIPNGGKNLKEIL